jgi:hypothetical protein
MPASQQKQIPNSSSLGSFRCRQAVYGKKKVAWYPALRLLSRDQTIETIEAVRRRASDGTLGCLLGTVALGSLMGLTAGKVLTVERWMEEASSGTATAQASQQRTETAKPSKDTGDRIG